MAESGNESASQGTSGGSSSGGGRDEDRLLPMANILRIMKKALPADGKISKEAKDAMQECVSEFICYITSEAAYKCKMDNRKIIDGDDVIHSMIVFGLDNYVEPLKIYLCKYRQAEMEFTGAIKGWEQHQSSTGGRDYPNNMDVEAENADAAMGGEKYQISGDDDHPNKMEVETEKTGAALGGKRHPISGDDDHPNCRETEAEKEKADPAIGGRQHQTSGDYDDFDETLIDSSEFYPRSPTLMLNNDAF